MNKIDLTQYPDVTYQDLTKALLSLNFINESTDRRFIYTYPPLDAKIMLPFPKSENDIIHKVHLWSNAFILQEKGVISNVNVLYKLVENQKYLKDNVLV